MATLRDLPARLSGSVGERVPVDDDDPAEPIGEHARGAEPGHARTDHDRLVPTRRVRMAAAHGFGRDEDRVERVAGGVVNVRCRRTRRSASIWHARW